MFLNFDNLETDQCALVTLPHHAPQDLLVTIWYVLLLAPTSCDPQKPCYHGERRSASFPVLTYIVVIVSLASDHHGTRK